MGFIGFRFGGAQDLGQISSVQPRAETAGDAGLFGKKSVSS